MSDTPLWPMRMVLGLFLSLQACSPDFLSPADYVLYIRDPDHGFFDRQEHAGVLFEAFYQPVEYVSLLQMSPDEISESLYAAALRDNAGFYQFMVSIRSATGEPIDQHLERVGKANIPFEEKKMHLLYRLQDCFSLHTNAGSLPCTFFHAEPSGKVDNAYHFVLAFEADSALMARTNDNDLILIYHDSLFVKERLQFTFSNERINQSPRLKL